MKPWMIVAALAIAALGVPSALGLGCDNGGCGPRAAAFKGDMHAVPGQPAWIDCGATMDCLRW